MTKKGGKSKGKRKTAKVSLSKLSNKRLNKLAKQGKLKKKIPKSKLLSLIKERVTDEKAPLEKEDREKEDIPLNEADYEYFATPDRDFSFLSSLNSDKKQNIKRKRAQNDDEEEADYEKIPRKGEERKKAILPIKTTEGGVIAREVSDSEQEDDSEQEEEEDEEEEPTEPQKPLPVLSTTQLFIQRQRKLAEKKFKIASLSSSIIENPEANITKLKELRLLLEESDPDIYITIKKLTMVSLLEVFKDIIPEYRIRETTQKEKEQSAKKETKQLRDFEESLLKNYKLYLLFLECVAKGKPIFSKDQSKRTSKGASEVDLPKEGYKVLMEVSVRCMFELLLAHPHFNYRTNVISVASPFVSHHNKKVSELACDYVKKIFKSDKSGEVSLEIVRLLGRIIKNRNFNVKPRVLETFLAMNIKEVETEEQKEQNKKDKKAEIMKLSRRDKKRKKHMQELEQELEEAAVTNTKKKRLKLNTEIINMLFLTYFRILKQARDSVLLSAVLEGVAKFAQLINIDFFDDIFNVMTELVESGTLNERESLNCVKTAFTILSGQGQVLNIDPLRFYTHLYKVLNLVNIARPIDDVPLAVDCLEIMITKRKKQMSSQRMLAFVKRLCTVCLQQSSHGIIGLLASARAFIHAHPRCDLLYDGEEQGSGMYMAELDEPEHCNANNTALYELHLIKNHYHPAVRRYTRHIISGAPSQGAGQLPVDISRKSTCQLCSDFDSSQMIFNPAIDSTPNKGNKRKQQQSKEFCDSSLRKEMDRVLEYMEKAPISKINFYKKTKSSPKCSDIEDIDNADSDTEIVDISEILTEEMVKTEKKPKENVNTRPDNNRKPFQKRGNFQRRHPKSRNFRR